MLIWLLVYTTCGAVQNAGHIDCFHLVLDVVVDMAVLEVRMFYSFSFCVIYFLAVDKGAGVNTGE